MSVLLKHVEWLLDNQGDRLQKALDRDNVKLTVQQALETIQDADPSERKLAVQWLFDCYIAKGFNWQALEKGSASKIHNILLAFGKYRNVVDGPRNLSEYKKLSHVIDVIDPHIKKEKEISGKALKRKEKEICLDESLIVHRSETVIVSAPQTQRAAVWWGKGTKWCTAAKKSENYFDNYHPYAPLVVFTFPNGLKEKVETKVLREEEYLSEDNGYTDLYGNRSSRYARTQWGEYDYDDYDDYEPTPNKLKIQKYYETVESWQVRGGATRLQVWIGREEVSLMNEKNETLSEEFVENNWQELSPIFEWMMIKIKKIDNEWFMENAIDTINLKDIAKKMTRDQILNIFKYQPGILNYRSDIVVSDQDWTAHALNHPEFLPKKLWTAKLAEQAILADPSAVEHVPLKLITSVFITNTAAQMLKADQNKLFRLIRQKIKSTRILECISKIEGSKSVSSREKKISLSPKNEEWADHIASGLTKFEWVPYNERNPELCHYGLKYLNAKLSYVPEAIKTYELCKLAIEQGNSEIFDVPVEHRTPDMFKAYFSISDNCFSEIPPGEITREIFEIAVKELIVKAQNLNDGIDSPETSILSDIPLSILERFEIKPELIKQIIDLSPNDLDYVKDKDKTPDILVSALSNDSGLINDNQHLLTNEIALRIYQSDRFSIEEIQEVYPDFIKKNWQAIQWKPEYFESLSDILKRECLSKVLAAEMIEEVEEKVLI